MLKHFFFSAMAGLLIFFLTQFKKKEILEEVLSMIELCFSEKV